MKRSFVIFLLVLNFGFLSHCFSAEDKTNLNEKILETFFRSLLSDTSAGYVLFGDRPVFFCTLPDETALIPGRKNHKWAVQMWAGLDAWKLISKESSNYILKESDPIVEMGLGHEFLLINKQAVLTAVEKNLPLFRLRMGVKITPEDILNNLTDPKIRITSLFKEQHTLLGVIFGYGSENGMVYERAATLIKSVEMQPLLPYQNKPSSQNEKEVAQEIQGSSIAPSLGFSSIKEEIDAMSHTLANPNSNLDGTSTKIPFTYVKDSKESKDLLLAYKQFQRTIDKVLISNNVLEQVLERFKAQKTVKDDIAITHISQDLLARSIWQTYLSIYPEEEADLEDFISGMRMAEKISSIEDFNDLDVMDSIRERRLLSPKSNLRYEKARKIFEEIAGLDNIRCIETDRIYFRTKHANLSQKQISQSTQSISGYILIQDLEGRVLTGSHHLTPPQSFKLSELIPGLSYGLKGMNLGETREIWIHPDYIYGIDSDFAEGAPVKVTVQLVDIKEGTEQLPELVPRDVALFQISNTPWKYLVKRYHVYSGYRIWAHIKNAQEIPLENIITSLRVFAEQPNLVLPLTQQERSLLLRYHWQIYDHPNIKS